MSSFKNNGPYLKHIGIPRRSGRYKWGSGENPNQHTSDIISRMDEFKRQGITKELDLVKALGVKNTTDLRNQIAEATSVRRGLELDTMQSMYDRGMNYTQIAKELGYNNESSVRSRLQNANKEKIKSAEKTAEFLKERVKEKGLIMIGPGDEKELNITETKMKQALYLLKEDGYEVYGRSLSQLTNPGMQTRIQVICPPGTPYKEIYNTEKINSIRDYQSLDGGETFTTFKYPASMNSKRVAIRYAEEGGTLKDGVIEIRRGVKDLSLGGDKYAQVRILVDGDRYLKGMAVYSDDIPAGSDILFNTNKPKTTDKRDVLKKITNDKDNPFGATIKPEGQHTYIDDDGKEKLGLINKKASEGDWSEWKDKVPSQFLVKQNRTLIKKQLDVSIEDKQAQFDEIMSIQNPTVKKNLLKAFSDECDSNATHLYAAALPGQKYHVLLPMNSLKNNEVYAPKYQDGEQLALVRFPHAGTFEIPILTVNNRNPVAKRTFGNITDAIGINSSNAQKLSGADFDGDTVMVIPTGGKIKISSRASLPELENFDSKQYKYTDIKKNPKTGEDEYYRNGKKMKVMATTNLEMGKASNLITDMQLKGATMQELAKAVKHSMVVIDAEKHKLDYKASEVENNIAALRKKYQGHIGEDGKYHEGASTLLSSAKSEVDVPKRQGSAKVNQKGKPWYDDTKPEGAYVYKDADESYVNNKGVTVKRMIKVDKMSTVNDARRLSSGTEKEELYADYANTLKTMANKARLEMVNAGKINYDATANKFYKAEVDRLDAALNVVIRNKPKERMASIIANSRVEKMKQDNPSLTSKEQRKELKKIKNQQLIKARAEVGAKREVIDISEKEWEAIQAGAISENKLSKILMKADGERVRQLALPKAATTVTSSQIALIERMSKDGYTISEISKRIGKPASTITTYAKGAD